MKVDKIALKRALNALAEMKLEGPPPETFFESIMYEKGDETSPFFSEAYLYSLVGKEDARLILHRVREVIQATGIEDRII